MTKDERVRFTLRIPKPIYEQLAQIAANKGIAINSEILDVLWRYMKEQQQGGQT